MKLDLIKKRFEKGFKSYDKYAFVQKQIARLLIFYLKNIKKDFNSIFEIGAGTGILSSLIEQNLNFKYLYLNDIVETSYFFLREKLKSSFTFICSDAQNLKISCDLLISSSTFQWFKNLEESLTNYNVNYLAFSLFLRGSLFEIKNLFNLGLNYLAYEDILKILKKLNYKILYSFYGNFSLTFKDLFEALRYLKYTGVNSLSKSLIPLNFLKEKNKVFIQKYQKLTFVYGIFIAKR